MASTEDRGVAAGGGIPLDDYTNDVERIHEVADYELALPSDLSDRARAEAGGLIVEPEVLEQSLTALSVGHLVLQGPPGTGKSSLARALAAAYGANLVAVTAHEDWSVYEVIGRQELRVDAAGNEAIVPVDGHFTTAAIDCAGTIGRWLDDQTRPQATWLMIDELNRAQMDKAFGELFSVLGTDDLVDIMLPHRPPGQRRMVVPRRFRIVATLNSIDNQFVNELSQGLRRRFTFVTLDLPRRRSAGEAWDSTDPQRSLAVQEFQAVLDAAGARVQRRLGANMATVDGHLAALHPLVVAIFEFAERLRYAGEGSPDPFIPVGTAQMIDTVELLLADAVRRDASAADLPPAADWAVSRRLVPLLEANIAPEVLNAFAGGLATPFDGETRREIRRIAAAGLHDVD